MTEQDPDLASRARGALEVVCAGRLDQLAVFYDESFVDHVNAMVFHGHSGARQSVGFYTSLFDPMRIEVEDQVAGHDQVASRWALYGTYRGREVILRGIVISRFQNGRIIEDHSYTDSLALPRALGVLRTGMLVADVLCGRVKLPRGALSHR
ncbi:ester cyclase [Conexibacter sp. DBS9H8]|uniref:ester cyclase n=1 Tax=Conexibacter sp. DBS9H8 TaxID=2937801 RepID=UPI00200BEF64|nr:ester cyclase [Conexibacter sp. DBS9H8]